MDEHCDFFVLQLLENLHEYIKDQPMLENHNLLKLHTSKLAVKLYVVNAKLYVCAGAIEHTLNL